MSGSVISERPDQALARMRSKILQKTVPDGSRITFDIPKGVSVALAAIPRCRQFYGHIFELKGIDREAIENLETYAKILIHLHAKCVSPAVDPDTLNALHNEAWSLREILVSQAELVMLRGALDRNALAGLIPANGYRNNAVNLQVVATKLNDEFDSIQKKMAAKKLICPLQKEEIERGLELSYEVISLVNQKEQVPDSTAENQELRLKTFLLFTEAWDEVCRGVSFVRWRNRDANTFTPSLLSYRNFRTGSKDTDEEENTDQGTVPTPSTPSTGDEPSKPPFGAPGGNPFRD